MKYFIWIMVLWAWTSGLAAQPPGAPPPLRGAGGLGTPAFAYLKISNPTGHAGRLTVLEMDKPGLVEPSYAISGQVRYQRVEGVGDLEMWSYFADGSTACVQTLDTQPGPLQQISGDSGWRPFVLPFRGRRGQFPTKIVLSLTLPGSGTVDVGQVGLTQYPILGWWSDRTGDHLATILSLVLSLSGLLVGALIYWRRGGRWVLASLAMMFLLAVAILPAAITAIATAQPRAVSSPLILAGVLCTMIPAALFPIARQRCPSKCLTSPLRL